MKNEAKVKVRRASTLQSLDELGLSNDTLEYLQKNFEDLGSIVKKGREIAYDFDTNPNSKKEGKLWMFELVSSIRELGFVRKASDFTTTFNVSYLYHLAHADRIKEKTITSITNEEYENFESITPKDLDQVCAALRDRLRQRDYDVMYLKLGLNGELQKGPYEVNDILKWSVNSIQAIINRSQSKIMWYIKLPIILDYPEDINDNPDELYELGIDYDTYEELRKANIRSIDDILAYAKGDKENYSTIGRKSMKKVELKMTQSGYSDFSFPELKRRAQLAAKIDSQRKRR